MTRVRLGVKTEEEICGIRESRSRKAGQHTVGSDWRARGPSPANVQEGSSTSIECPASSAMAVPPPHPVPPLWWDAWQVAPSKLRGTSPKLLSRASCRRPVAHGIPARGVARGKGEASRLSITCRRSFQRAAPRDAETTGPRAAPPIVGHTPATRSVSPAPASATCDSISPLELP
jgi:hypothetical protein